LQIDQLEFKKCRIKITMAKSNKRATLGEIKH